MVSVPPSFPSQAPGLAAGLAGVAVGLVWYGLLMRGLWAAQAIGPVCHHDGAFATHCPACYAALALVAAGSLAIVRALAPRLAVRARA
jgi:hypothetical protein